MKRVRIFNEEEIKILLKNPNIIGLKDKSQIIYNDKFKYWAVIQKINNPDKTAREIFEMAGFDMNIISEQTPRRRLKFWVEQFKKFGSEYFIKDNEYRYKAKENNKRKIYLNNGSEELSLIKTIEKNNICIARLIMVIEKLLRKL